METTRQIVENRTNALGVAENSIQVAGERRIVGEFPGVEDANSVLSTIQQTGLLEFVDTGDERMPEGMIIQTDFSTGAATPTETAPVATCCTRSNGCSNCRRGYAHPNRDCPACRRWYNP